MIADSLNFSDSQTTIERIIQSATQLFATKGFQRTLVQEIAKDASCNVACINYHCHGKEQIYKKVFERQVSKIVCSLHSLETDEKKSHSNVFESHLRSFVNIEAIQRKGSL